MPGFEPGNMQGFEPGNMPEFEPEKNDLSSEGHLTKTIFIAVFGIFT
jgi:hypothetical protein